MKNLILILLLITFSIQSQDEEKYIQIKKYGFHKINDFNTSIIKFTLDVSKIKTNISLLYYSSMRVDESLINYQWSKDDYKNIKVIESENISYYCKENENYIYEEKKIMFSLSCDVEKKNNAYNTLIIIVKQKKLKYFKDFEIVHVSNERESFGKNIWIIIFYIIIIPLLIICSVIGICIYCFFKCKQKRNLNEFENGLTYSNVNNNNLIIPMYNQYNSTQINNQTNYQ